MSDYIARATGANETVRAFAINSGEMVAEARERHRTFPVVTAALGRLMSATAMLGSMMKGEDDKLTVTMKGDGPIGQMTVTVDSHGNVKGFPANPSVDIPLKYAGKLDVGAAVGAGTMTVSMDLGLKEPYNGQVELQTGEIGDDFAYYFTVSEQTPSAVGLGVMINKDSTVRHSGGFIIQMMPDAEEETIALLEQNLQKAGSVSQMMEQGMTPVDMLNTLLEGLQPEILETTPVQFHCGCSKEHVSRALSTIQTGELDQMIQEGESIEVKCHFCNSTYHFTVEELKEILAQRNNKK